MNATKWVDQSVPNCHIFDDHVDFESLELLQDYSVGDDLFYSVLLIVIFRHEINQCSRCKQFYLRSVIVYPWCKVAAISDYFLIVRCGGCLLVVYTLFKYDIQLVNLVSFVVREYPSFLIDTLQISCLIGLSEALILHVKATLNYFSAVNKLDSLRF